MESLSYTHNFGYILKPVVFLVSSLFFVCFLLFQEEQEQKPDVNLVYF